MCKPYCDPSISNNLILSKTISYTKHPILLVKSSLDASEYIIKAFTKDSYSRSSYLKEKKILSSINHPNIIQYIKDNLFQVSIPQRACILMEYAPYGDFFNLVIENNFSNEMLVRTYFHQLIQGLEHIHSRGIAHLDVKLENLLLGKDLQLKIADFDMAQSIKDEDVLSQGSENYRAPEIISGDCVDFCAADVYSAGVCLFILISKAFPFIEEGLEGVLQRYDDFLNRNEDFWDGFENLLKNKIQFSESLRELLNGMWKENPEERLNLKKIKESRWFNEPIYKKEELKVVIQAALRK